MKHFISLLVICFFAGSIFAQDLSLPKETKRNPWRFGGNFGFGIGNKSTTIQIAPAVGYMVTSQLEFGASLGYTYHKYNDYKSNIFTSGVFSSFQIIPQAFLRADFEHHTGKQKFRSNSVSFDENSLWIGGGYQSTGNVRFQAGMMYNVLYNKDKSIYNSPWRPFAGVSISF